MASLMRANGDAPSRKVFESKRNWFEPWLFGMEWGQAKELSANWKLWGKYIETCVEKHSRKLSTHK